MATSGSLGSLVGGQFHQYANLAGQVYYYNTATRVSSFGIPPGFEDRRTDTWTRHPTRALWTNDRTGRVVFIDPNPPTPQTYLDKNSAQAALTLLERVPESGEDLYRRAMVPILRFLFPEEENYEIIQEVQSSNSRPDICALKVGRREGGTLYQYEFMLVECKKADRSWPSTEDHLYIHLSDNSNDSKNVYGMIQLGMNVQFYKYEGHVCSKLGDRMHLIRDVHQIIGWTRWMHNNPMPFI